MGVRLREHLPRIEAALAALYDYADALIADRQRSPRDDFVTCLVQAQAGPPGQLGEPEAGPAARHKPDEAGPTPPPPRGPPLLLVFCGVGTPPDPPRPPPQAVLGFTRPPRAPFPASPP